MDMKKIILTPILMILLTVSFASCAKDQKNTNENEIPAQIAEDMKVDPDDLTERELELIEHINDTQMRDFTLPDFDGNTHSLSDYNGQIIILNFWAVGCPPCINEMPDFDKVAQKDGVVLVTVAQNHILGNNKEESYEFINQFDTVALWDEKQETAGIYPSQYYPHTYIIDRSGVVRFVINSASYELLDELVSFCDEKFN